MKYINSSDMTNVPPGTYIDRSRMLKVVHAGKSGTLKICLGLPHEVERELAARFWADIIMPKGQPMIDPKTFLDVAVPCLT